MSVLSRPEFHDEQAAYDYVEARLWPEGPTCPKCGERERVSKMGGKSTRIGAYKCYKCRKPFTVKVGTIFESSHVKMHLWLQAIYLICASKKGISANQLHRTLGVTLKTAWFMGHRIREAMRSDDLTPLGGAGSTVEADETYFGSVEDKRTTRTDGRPFLKTKYGQGGANKRVVVSLVERDGRVRSFHPQRATKAGITEILRQNIDRESQFYTDESRLYNDAKHVFPTHQHVKHSASEYVRGDVHTNTVEGVFSIFKRGMKGVYQHCREKHLHRYLAEFDFRYNNRVALGVNDDERAVSALLGVAGKRLKYADPK